MDEEVFLEALYEAVHAVGCSCEDRETLIRYLQEVDFPDKNAAILQRVKEKEAPRVCLKVNVVGAKDLKPHDPNGLSDPFCALYLSSSPDQQQLTSYKSETLSPTWDETFLLSLENAAEDILYVEVWDFDPEETTCEKIKKIKEVRGIKGVKMLMKEVAHSNKQQNDFIGMAKISLKDVPAKGLNLWCDVEKEGKQKRQGLLRLQLSFVFDRSCEVPYRKLVRLILEHELSNFKGERHRWDGKLSTVAETLLEQHRLQYNMELHADAVVRWVELVDMHLENPFSVGLFLPMLAKLVLCLRDGILNNEQQTLFLEAGQRLLRECVADVRRSQMNITDPHLVNKMLQIMSIISQLVAVNHLEDKEDVLAAVNAGICDWFTILLEEDNSGSNEIETFILVTGRVTTYWNATSKYDDLFWQHFQIPYSNIAYKLLGNKLVELIQPVVVPLCKSLSISKVPTDSPVDFQDSVSLFQLYLALRKLFGSASSKYPTDQVVVLLPNLLEQWFYPAAVHWIMISLYKSFHAIKNAVNLDRLERIDENSEITGSALDVMHIFQKVKVFWEQLAWLDVEMAFVFAVNIINDICDCTLLYVDKLCEKVETQRNRSGDVYNVPRELCSAANNIHYLLGLLPQTIREFGAEQIAARLTNNDSVDICQQTIKLITNNVIDTVTNKKTELFKRTAKKIAIEFTSMLKQSANEEMVFDYLDNNLRTLHNHLNPENFTNIFGLVWKNVVISFHEYVTTAVKVLKDVSHFRNCAKILNGTVDYFKNLDENIDMQLAVKLEQLLVLNSMNPSELIHQYYKMQLIQQKTEVSSECGLLTVRLQIADDTLRIEILNARNIHLSVNRTTCNPYVKMSLQPRHVFSELYSWVTKVHKKTVYPLFDEVFEIKMSAQLQNTTDGLVIFELKDKHYVGTDKLLGEAFFSLREIPKTDVKLEYLEQIHLKLVYPSDLDTEPFRVLEHHQDKTSKEFVRYRRQLVQANCAHISNK